MAIAGIKEQRLNDDITYEQIRLVSDSGEQLGILSPDEARKIAEERGMDLVEIAPNAEPPVCRLMDYGKYLYASAKKKQESKKKQKQITVKEIKFRPGTDIGDYDIKVRNLTKFLDAGNKVKVTLRFRGREMAHQELGMEMLKRVEEDLKEIGVVEQMPKMEGRQMVMVLAPLKA
ncbi:MAG TPA: translation initiation factor IF-3 [Gammaproteobacteria bacterium]|nr:MAG: translation initiation factor IF-3 [Candidatus Thioglobus sp. MED-G23]RPG01692.1 MAG: translation initiation factor IF-3 [Proteobacteria bacterium TMED51]HAU42285.1 translation initiation factor IF-3 [Gammaproteobacteria bacterium]HCL93952.1 translation initiation factor IF-3 [Gammaproteobacteria bacterium]